MIEMIILFFTNIIEHINALSGGNQFIGGVITAGLSGVGLYLLKDLPRSTWNIIKNQSTTTVHHNNASYEKLTTFDQIGVFLSNYVIKGFSRTLAFETVYNRKKNNNDVKVVLGFGKHLAYYKGKFILINKQEHPSNQGDTIKETMSLTILGRNHTFFNEFINDVQPPYDKSIRTYSLNSHGSWNQDNRISNAGLNTIALDKNIRSIIRKEMEKFINGKKETVRVGLPHKISVLLHGLPGSGKTALIRAIACEYDLNICQLNIASTSDSMLIKAINNIPPNSLLLMEDFDSAKSVCKPSETPVMNLEMNTRSGILNLLNGVVGLDGVAVFMTTNYIERIDPALKRGGRTDLIIELPPITKEAIREHFESLYSDIHQYAVKWSELPGCVIHKIKRAGLNGTKEMVDMINYYHDNPDKAEAEQRGEVEYLRQVRELELAAAIAEMDDEIDDDDDDDCAPSKPLV